MLANALEPIPGPMGANPFGNDSSGMPGVVTHSKVALGQMIY